MTNARSFAIAIAFGLWALPVAAQQIQPIQKVSTAITSPVTEPSVGELLALIQALEHQIEALKKQVVSQQIQAQNTGESSGSSEELEERLAALDQRVRVLAREDEIRREAAAEQARTAPAIAAGREGFQLRSADNAFVLRLRGLVQADSRQYVDDTIETGVNSFVLRRVRPIVEATLFRNFDFRLTPDFGNGQTVLQDAYLDLRFSPMFRVRAGKQKQPFGLERLVSASDTLMVERALPTGVAGNRDLGVNVNGDLLAGRLSYAAGVFNGVIDGGSADADERDGKDIVTRVFAHPFRTSENPRLQGLGLGVAASFGSHIGALAAPGVAAYRTAGQQTFFRFLADGTLAGTTIADGDRYRISAQGYYYSGRFGALVEQVRSTQDVRRGTARAQAVTSSWQVAPSWVLTGEPASYRGAAPRASFDYANGSWGALELTGRFNELSVSDELFPTFANASVAAQRARGGAIGLNWYVNRNVKIVLNYEETHFRGGAVNGNRRTERDLLSRVQFSF